MGGVNWADNPVFELSLWCAPHANMCGRATKASMLTSSMPKNTMKPMLVASSCEGEFVMTVVMVMWVAWMCNGEMWGRECGEKKEMNRCLVLICGRVELE